MSESINFGHTNISTEITITGSESDMKIGLTSNFLSVFTKIIKEKNTNNKLNNKKTYCQLLTKIILHNAIANTGTEKKNR